MGICIYRTPYRTLSSELLNCKITDTVDKMRHQECNVNKIY